MSPHLSLCVTLLCMLIVGGCEQTTPQHSTLPPWIRYNQPHTQGYIEHRLAHARPSPVRGSIIEIERHLRSVPPRLRSSVFAKQFVGRTIQVRGTITEIDRGGWYGSAPDQLIPTELLAIRPAEHSSPIIVTIRPKGENAHLRAGDQLTISARLLGAAFAPPSRWASDPPAGKLLQLVIDRVHVIEHRRSLGSLPYEIIRPLPPLPPDSAGGAP